MKKGIAIITLLLALPLSSQAGESDRGPSLQRLRDLPGSQARLHRASNISFCVTNFGVLGSYDDLLRDPDYPNASGGTEFPIGSGLENLFFGAIWLGAEIDTVDSLGNPILDTLVSVGNDGWWGQVFELCPPAAEYPSIWRDTITADDEIFCIYTDTTTDSSFVERDPIDNRPHIPLGIKITQHSMCWGTPGYNELFIISFIMDNLGSRNLHNLWLGIYYDGDVYHNSENPYGSDRGIQDDLSGFLHRDGGRGIAYAIDNDGQVWGYPLEGQFTPQSSVNCMGLSLLYSSESGIGNSFNWWISNINSAYDWGPQWQSNFDIWGNFPGGGRGTPGGDKAKYQIMSNHEIDYDQIWCGLDWREAGWIGRPLRFYDIFNGYDTRYLLSYGPIQLPQGGTDTLVFAYVGGKNIHVLPSNYFEHLQYNPTDSELISRYYATLDFSDLVTKADSAMSFFLNGYDEVPIGPPGCFRMTGWDASHVSFAWRPVNHPRLREYRVYRGTSSRNYGSVPITPDGFRDTVFTDTSVIDDSTYYYTVRSVKDNGLEGGYSQEAAINVGLPHAPMNLYGIGGNNQITLYWQPSGLDGDISGYIIYRGLARNRMSVIDTADGNSYTNGGLENCRHYYYAMRALDYSGNTSITTDTLDAIPMARNLGILLIDANVDNERNPDIRLMRQFYIDALEGYPHSITTIPPDSLGPLSRYSTIIWCKELSLGDDYLIPSNMLQYLQDYLENGGNLIIEGTRNLVSPVNFQGIKIFADVEFQNQYLNLSGVEFPNFSDNTEFVGGRGAREGFPDFSLDTARVDRIVFPRDDSTGRLMGMGVLAPHDSSEVIYFYRAVYPDTSNFDGRPIGIIHHGLTYYVAALEFPLYFVEEERSFEILHNILAILGEQRVDAIGDNAPLPDKFNLLQNYPNPFNNVTVLSYSLREDGYTSLSIYNILGQKIAVLFSGYKKAGKHSVSWDANGVPSGVYFARLECGKESSNRKMVLLK